MTLHPLLPITRLFSTVAHFRSTLIRRVFGSSIPWEWKDRTPSGIRWNGYPDRRIRWRPIRDPTWRKMYTRQVYTNVASVECTSISIYRYRSPSVERSSREMSVVCVVGQDMGTCRFEPIDDVYARNKYPSVLFRGFFVNSYG